MSVVPVGVYHLLAATFGLHSYTPFAATVVMSAMGAGQPRLATQPPRSPAKLPSGRGLPRHVELVQRACVRERGAATGRKVRRDESVPDRHSPVPRCGSTGIAESAPAHPRTRHVLRGITAGRKPVTVKVRMIDSKWITIGTIQPRTLAWLVLPTAPINRPWQVAAIGSTSCRVAS